MCYLCPNYTTLIDRFQEVTVTTAIVPVRSQEVAAASPPPVPAPPPAPAAVPTCIVQMPDKSSIGEFVMHSAGGTQIRGQIDPKMNPVIPAGLRAGSVELFVHQQGLRMVQGRMLPLMLRFADLAIIKPIQHTEILSHRGDGTLVDFVSRMISTGPIAAVFAGFGAQYDWELKKDFLFFEDHQGAQLLLEVTEHTATLFCSRVRELQPSPEVKKKGFWR